MSALLKELCFLHNIIYRNIKIVYNKTPRYSNCKGHIAI